MEFDTAKSAVANSANGMHETGQSNGRYEQPEWTASPFPSPTAWVKEPESYVRLFGGMYDQDSGMSNPKQIGSSADEDSNQAPDVDPDCPAAPRFSVDHGAIDQNSKTVSINYKFSKGVNEIRASWINQNLTGAAIYGQDRVIGHKIDWKQENQPKFSQSAFTSPAITQTSEDGIYTFSEVLPLPTLKNLPSLVSSFITCADPEAHLIVTQLDEDDHRDVEAQLDIDKEDEILQQRNVGRPMPFIKGDNDNFDIDPNDIAQRETGDCYIMAILMSFANTANGREIIKSMIKEQPIYKDKKQRNTFGVRFPAYEGTEVSVNNSYPYYSAPPRSNTTVYQATTIRHKEGFQNAQPGDKNSEVWPMLIEKALAILAGHNFQQINNGNVREAYYLLTRNSKMKNIINEQSNSDAGETKYGLEKIGTSEIENNEKAITYRVDDCVIGETAKASSFKAAKLSKYSDEDVHQEAYHGQEGYYDQEGYYIDKINDKIPICSSHVYSLLRIHYDKEKKSKTYDFKNPHGKHHLDNITEEQLRRYFPTVNWGSITPPVNDTKLPLQSEPAH